MKSPTSSVGTIEEEGILNGSTRNERNRNTIRITGKKLTEYSTHHGCFASLPLPLARKAISTSPTSPVTASRMNRNRAKLIASSSRVASLQHRQECFLRDFDRADLLHAFLALFLLVEQLALARDVSAV